MTLKDGDWQVRRFQDTLELRQCKGYELSPDDRLAKCRLGFLRLFENRQVSLYDLTELRDCADPWENSAN